MSHGSVKTPLLWSTPQAVWSRQGVVWNGSQTSTEGKIMMVRVSRGFCEIPDSPLGDFAVGVHDGMTANASVFADPPVTMVALNGATTTFLSKLALANKGSVAQTADKDAARAALIVMLRQLAAYVEQIANGDVVVIGKSGFEALVGHHVPSQPLSKPSIIAILNEVSTQVVLRVSADAHTSAIEVQKQNTDNSWTTIKVDTKMNRILIAGLTSGTVYTFRVRAIGGSTGESDWSDPVTHMCT